MKISRLLSILTLLLNNEKLTATELSKRFEVSVRTIIRDMDALNEAGIPIISYQGYEGGYGLVEGYKLDKSIMTTKEANLVLCALKGIDDALGHSAVRNLMGKIEHLANLQDDQKIRIDLVPWGIQEFEREKLTAIYKAIELNKYIEIDYIDMNGKFSKRNIEPLLLSMKVATWYLYAYCTLRNDFRLFKVSRITSINLLKQTFEPRIVEEDKIFENDPRPLVHLKLLFSKNCLYRLYDYFEYKDVHVLQDDTILVEVTYPEDEWVYSTLLSFGGNLKVLEPEYVKEEILLRAKNILQAYN